MGAQTKVGEYNGIPIFVDEAGKFTIKKDDQLFQDRTMSGLLKKLAVNMSPIEVFVDSGYRSILLLEKRLVVPDRNRRRWRDAETGKLLDEHGRYFLYNAEIEQELNGLIAEYQALVERYNQTLGKLEWASIHSTR